MGQERLTLRDTNCGEDEHNVRLYGLGDDHYINTAGEYVSTHALEIAEFVSVRFDPTRGDRVLLEGKNRGVVFEGSTDTYPFAPQVRGEGWDNSELYDAIIEDLRVRHEIRSRAQQAKLDRDLGAAEQAVADWKKIRHNFPEKSIQQRNMHYLAPAVNHALDEIESSGNTGRLFVVAGGAHFTEYPETIYPTLQRTQYHIYIDNKAKYLKLRQERSGTGRG